MRIGIDIDNTICSTNLVANKLYLEKHDINFDDLDKNEQYDFIGKNGDVIFDDCPLEENALEIINKLRKNNKIYLITARCGRYVNNIEKRTLEYLDKNNIKYDGIYFGHDSKIDIFNKLDLDVMIDDDFDVYEEITLSGKKAIMYDGVLNKNKNGIKVHNCNELYILLKEEFKIE